jgi:hypothetical protein
MVRSSFECRRDGRLPFRLKRARSPETCSEVEFSLITSLFLGRWHCLGVCHFAVCQCRESIPLFSLSECGLSQMRPSVTNLPSAK